MKLSKVSLLSKDICLSSLKIHGSRQTFRSKILKFLFIFTAEDFFLNFFLSFSFLLLFFFFFSKFQAPNKISRPKIEKFNAFC